MKKVIGYIRVSTLEQAESGLSLKAQEQKIRQYAELYGLELSEIVEDPGFSAKNMNRPGFQRILSMMQKKEIGCLIVAKLDRMTRSIKDLAELVEIATKKDVALISVNEHIDTGTAAGRMILNMLGVISQWEREAIGERTSSALQYKKQSGKVYNCNALYGYENRSGNLVPVESEREIIALIVHFRDQRYSYKAISEKLNAMGKLSRSGKWYSEQVRRVILHSADRKLISPKVEFAT